MTSIKAPSLPSLLPLAGRTPERASPAAFQGLMISSSGLSAQRLRMEVAAANLANMNTTRTAEGGAYQRRIVTMQPAPAYGPAPRALGDYGPIPGGVQITGVAIDTSPGDVIYDPTHPDAGTDGYVRMPNVDQTQETVTLMEALRLYQAIHESNLIEAHL